MVTGLVFNPAAAKDEVVPVKNTSLTRGNGPLRGLKFNDGLSARLRCYGCSSTLVVVADFGCDVE